MIYSTFKTNDFTRNSVFESESGSRYRVLNNRITKTQNGITGDVVFRKNGSDTVIIKAEILKHSKFCKIS